MNDASTLGPATAATLGLGIPLLTLRHAGRPLQVLAGLVMVTMGVAIMTGQLTTLSYWLLERFPVLGRLG
jgi:cytochrome c-type biogenesis protein